ncbi:MAG: GNAT family N-acetyltransferase [Chloroflexi bacterium]|nr:GNAT family N-acetyltransferase [Anaerolineaceae bacterium]NMB89102.1 GNAT family N-acetyltransferase [Chloroflexota bacterium]
MADEVQPGSRLQVFPLTPERWPDLEQLFGTHGAYGGCWCMWWRLKRADFNNLSAENRKAALKGLVDAGPAPGLLGYVEGVPAGWVSLAPREAYPPLARSRILKPVDDRPAWSVVCFFVARAFRRQGLMSALLQAAVQFAGENGAQIVEGYPIDTPRPDYPDVYAYTGLMEAFRRAGFVEVERRSPTRPLMRCFLGETGS